MDVAHKKHQSCFGHMGMDENKWSAGNHRSGHRMYYLCMIYSPKRYIYIYIYIYYYILSIIKGSLGGETSVLRTFRMSGKELVKERVSQGKVS